jgi:hypothetical protein
MKLYPFGTVPSETPPWFATAMAAVGLSAGDFPIWHLDTKQDWSNPAALLLRLPPDYTLFRHGHPCQRFEVVIQGSLEVGDGRTAGVGDVFTADAGTLYGPHTAGPEGCTTLEIFSAIEGAFRLLWENADGEIQESDARKGEFPPTFVPLPEDFNPLVRLG